MEPSMGHAGREGTVYTIDELLFSHVGVGKYQLWLLVACGLSFMADAFEVTLLSYLSVCAADGWGLSSSAESSITASVFFGEMLGALCWGPFSDHYGRKPAFILAASFILVFGLLSATAPNVWCLIVARMLVGFGVGGVFVPFDLLAELSSSQQRGRNLLYIEFFWALGSLSVVLFAWALLESQGWRVLTLLCALPVLLSLLSSRWIPESPRWLLVKGKPEAALQVLRVAARVNGRKLPSDAILAEPTKTEGVRELGCGNVGELWLPRLRKTTTKVWLLWLCYGFAYYGVVLLNAKVFEADRSGSSCSFGYGNMAVVASAEGVGVLLVLFLIDPAGRVVSQAATYLLGAVCVLPIAYQISPNSALVFFSFMARAFMLASSSSTWVHLPELYPTEIRGTAHAWAGLQGRVGSFLSPYWVQSSLSIFTSAMGVAVVLLVAGLLAATLPETSGKDLDGSMDFTVAATRLQGGAEEEEEEEKEETRRMEGRRSGAVAAAEAMREAEEALSPGDYEGRIGVHRHLV